MPISSDSAPGERERHPAVLRGSAPRAREQDGCEDGDRDGRAKVLQHLALLRKSPEYRPFAPPIEGYEARFLRRQEGIRRLCVTRMAGLLMSGMGHAIFT